MRAGGGGKKGSSFERKICKALSRWVSAGRHEDLFWRTAMSGGRATVARKRGGNVRQSGDICAVERAGHPFTNQWYIECKAYANVDFGQWVTKDVGRLAKWWKLCRKEAHHYKKDPMLIIKQNGWPWLVITRTNHAEHWTVPQARISCRRADVYLWTDMIAAPYKTR